MSRHYFSRFVPRLPPATQSHFTMHLPCVVFLRRTGLLKGKLDCGIQENATRYNTMSGMCHQICLLDSSRIMDTYAVDHGSSIKGNRWPQCAIFELSKLIATD